MKTAQQIFTEAFALVRNQETWTQGNWARTADGDFVHPESPSAVCWCSSGAMCRALPGDVWSREADMVWDALNREMGGNVPRFNDTHTHAEVVAAWERAGKAQGWL